MRSPGVVRRDRLAGVFVVLLALVLAAWLPGERTPFGQGIEGRLLDARFQLRGPQTSPDGVAIVAFDDAAMAEIDSFPPSRTALAETVADVAASGARVIVLDLLLVGARDDDQALVEALGATDTVLAVAEAPPGTAAPDLPPGTFAVVVSPQPAEVLPALGPAEALARSATLGHVTIAHEADGAVRRMRPTRALMTSGGLRWYPGLAVAAVTSGGVVPSLRRTAGGGMLELGAQVVPLDLQGTIPLSYYGSAGAIPTVSAADLDGSDLSGRIVFIGATSTGFGDLHVTPFDATLPGVELHATFAANLSDGRTLRRDAVAWVFTGLLAIAAAMAGFTAFRPEAPVAVALTGSAALAATTGILQTAFLAGWWLDATTVLAALVTGGSTGAVLLWADQRRRAANLSRYQAPGLVNILAEDAMPRFAEESQVAVVLFVDVAGFTGHAEGLTPQEAQRFLRLFHGLLEDAAVPTGGTIAHFAGDGAMILFGVPEPGSDDAAHALRFINLLYAGIRNTPSWPGLGVRVGGHTGPVQTGLVGGAGQRHLSVSGDVVNTASRLQEFAGAQGKALALSDALVSSSVSACELATRFGLEPAGPQELRGRRTLIEVWTGPAPEVVVPPDDV